MKLTVFLVICAALAVGYYQACAIPAAERRGRELERDAAHMDSITAAAQAAEAVLVVRDSVNAAWQARDSARADTVGRLRGRLARLSDSTRGLTARLDSLPMADSVREAVAQTVTALEDRAETCELALDAQTGRLTDCQQVAATADSLANHAVPILRAVTDSALAIAQRWQARARQAEKPWSLGIGVGPGMFWTPGDSLMRFGIGVTLAVQYRVFRLPPW